MSLMKKWGFADIFFCSTKKHTFISLDYQIMKLKPHKFSPCLLYRQKDITTMEMTDDFLSSTYHYGEQVSLSGTRGTQMSLIYLLLSEEIEVLMEKLRKDIIGLGL